MAPKRFFELMGRGSQLGQLPTATFLTIRFSIVMFELFEEALKASPAHFEASGIGMNWAFLITIILENETIPAFS